MKRMHDGHVSFPGAGSDSDEDDSHVPQLWFEYDYHAEEFATSTEEMNMLALRAQVLETKQGMMLRYEQVVGLMPAYPWTRLICDLLGFKGPVTDEIDTGYLLVILQCMVTLLYLLVVHKNPAIDISDMLILMRSDGIILIHWADVVHGPVMDVDDDDGGRGVLAMSSMLKRAAVFPETMPQLLDRVAKCEIWFKKSVGQFLADTHYTFLEDQYTCLCRFASADLATLIEDTVNEAHKRTLKSGERTLYRLLLYVEGMADLLYRYIVKNELLCGNIRNSRIPSIMNTVPHQFELSTRVEVVINKLAEVFKEATKYEDEPGIFDDILYFQHGVYLWEDISVEGVPPVDVARDTAEAEVPDEFFDQLSAFGYSRLWPDSSSEKPRHVASVANNIGFVPLDGHGWSKIQNKNGADFYEFTGDSRLKHVNPSLVVSWTSAKGVLVCCGNRPLKVGAMLCLFTGVHALEKDADAAFGTGPCSVVTNYAFEVADCMTLAATTASIEAKPFNRILIVPRVATGALPPPHQDTQSLVNVRVPSSGVADFGALFNHSNIPNCEVQKAIIDGHLILVIYTIRTLKAWEEAVIDYGYTSVQGPFEHANSDDAPAVVNEGHYENHINCFSKEDRDDLFILGDNVKSAFDAMGMPLTASLYGPPVEVKLTVHSTYTLVVDTSQFAVTNAELRQSILGHEPV